MKKMETLYILAFIVLSSLACILSPSSAAGELALDAHPTMTMIRPESTKAPAVTTCTVATGWDGGHLNLRSCDGTDCSVINVLDEGDVLEVLSGNYDWVHVETDEGVQGFVNIKYCELENKK